MRAVAVKAFRADPELIQLPKPEPGRGEVLVKVEYAALNPFDWRAADGLLEGRVPHVFPLVMGTDFAGRVDVVGPGDNRFRVGDAVFGQAGRPPVGTGTYAEYVTMPQDAAIAFVPDGLPLRTAALLPTAGMSAAQILEAAGVRAGQSLLVVGAAGGVGSYLTQLAAAGGVRVLAAVRGDEQRRMSALGAAVTVDTTRQDLAAAVRDACPDGLDGLVDVVSADAGSFAANAALVRSGGRALTTRSVLDPARLPAGVEGVDFHLRASSALLDTLAAAALDGSLRAPVDAELPLEKAPDALAQSRAGGARGKTVFVL
ncbi:NADP-dependent oxidoreductase [Streptomyces lunaelactis]|uniref:NADP-dependent oxidoreductase n=1 Tax=Streptomyces lunaelactis TaxID=1535768 RepID=UPI0015855548|nr:NADP-dependent oxidoreductase [Streptomyces lunaelactis]NUK03596.1 NADP-dependent oxidoreductase [Streptomyces lunaelactis]NUK18019.1 NADP-dependent oxidoreductase [Streptomyces lunaelactis]NUK25297.1 NADP-dependent oxidoreductase [Streptomyces lunaelactis]NUK52186.1 NADP-dependent oxidoreductase [Streptomyces lunaelactis]NUK67900.1 NADP-dependent oxidoreductase [Streptomyces lunaelactis]